MQNADTLEAIKLTAYSHGAGCGCKIAPTVLKEILGQGQDQVPDPYLLVGNCTSDDAAIYDIGNGQAIISTTDFFMPIVDDPFDFGAIASVNALSDVYAMGGTPIMAIAILGWPVDKISTAHAARVLEGSRSACAQAGIQLAGGHSIDAPEPIFGLAVTGKIATSHLKTNSAAQVQDALYLTKPLGVGIMATAQKRSLTIENHLEAVRDCMLKINIFGTIASRETYVNAMTDITGFGLLGHLIELCEGSGLSAELQFDRVPVFPFLQIYLDQDIRPGGTTRNLNSYGNKVTGLNESNQYILADPQTSGGLLIAVDHKSQAEFENLAARNGEFAVKIGRLTEQRDGIVNITDT